MNIETETGWLDDIELEMVDISDTFSKAIARYEYPYADGADLEDMGQKARTLKIRCYFFDNAAQSTYNDHITLIDYLSRKSDFELLHPKYGILHGKVENVNVRHDERKRCAEVDIDFIEQMRDSIEASVAEDVADSVETAFENAQEEQYSSIVTAAIAAVGSKVMIDVPAENSLMVQFVGLTGPVRDFAAEVDVYVRRFEAQAIDITNPANSLVAGIHYATNLPGRLLGSITRAVERHARLFDALAAAPARFLASLDNGLLKLQVTIAVPSSGRRAAAALSARSLIAATLKIACAQRLALEAAYLYQADDRADSRAMNANDLEASLALVRTRLQEALDLDRGITGLTAMACSLLEHVTAAKSDRESLITVDIDRPLPLHIICLRYGLSSADAERLQALNRFRNTNSISGEVQIYVR
jgi:prophage DNA circulation protein